MKNYLVFAFFYFISSYVWSQSYFEQPVLSSNANGFQYKYLWSNSRRDSGDINKQFIDFAALDNWPTFGSDLKMTRDGKYFEYRVESTIGFGLKVGSEKDTLVVKSTTGTWQHTIVDGKSGFFSGNSKQFIYQVNEDLYLLELGSRNKRVVKDISSYQRPEKNWNDKSTTRWLAWQLKDEDRTVFLEDLFSGKQLSFRNVHRFGFDPTASWFFCELMGSKAELFITNIFEDKQRVFTNVESFVFSSDGNNLLLNKSNQNIEFIDLLHDQVNSIWTKSDPESTILSFSFNKKGDNVMFVTNEVTGRAIWYWTRGMRKAEMKMNGQVLIGSDKELLVGEAFFTDGNYIEFDLFSGHQRRQPDSNASQIDVWSYKDAVIQSSQAWQLQKQFRYKAVLNPITNSIVPLGGGDRNLRVLTVSGDFAVVAKTTEGDKFWEKDYGLDSTWIVSLLDGSKRLLSTRANIEYKLSVSPGGRYLVYFDKENGCNYFSYEFQTGKLNNLTGSTPAYQFGYVNPFLRTTEKPANPAGYRIGQAFAAWVGDDELLVYDNYDIWQLNLSGDKAAINFTEGYGHKHSTKFLLGRDTYRFKLGDTLLITAFDVKSKYSGYYKKILGTKGNPKQLFMGPTAIKRYICSDGSTAKISFESSWIVQKGTDTRSPNYFFSKDLETFQQISFLAPEKKYYLYTAELHHFEQPDGTYSQGILYKPENFNPKRKYPVIISFYGDQTDQLYDFMKPQYNSFPAIFDRPSWIVNQGYLLFVPDIYFVHGQWGPSTINSVEGAARYMRKLSYVDVSHLGATGHSNSGIFGYYLLTHSHSFAAMSVGAATTNIISGALTVNLNEQEKSFLQWGEKEMYGTGLESSIWQDKEKWIDHTAVLQTDNAISPLLLFHNKADGVPIEYASAMYISMRRLEKRCWWLQYDNGGHSVANDRDRRDFTIRFTQFFDHYLKCAPAPRWMTQGIPAALKTIESRFELDAAGSCAMKGKNVCHVCNAWNKQYARTPEMFEKPIAEWQLDKDIKAEMDKNEAKRHADNMKGEAQRIKENNQKLNGTWKPKSY